MIQASEAASQSYTTAMNALQDKGTDAQADVKAFIESNEVKDTDHQWAGGSTENPAGAQLSPAGQCPSKR